MASLAHFACEKEAEGPSLGRLAPSERILSPPFKIREMIFLFLLIRRGRGSFLLVAGLAAGGLKFLLSSPSRRSARDSPAGPPFPRTAFFFLGSVLVTALVLPPPLLFVVERRMLPHQAQQAFSAALASFPFPLRQALRLFDARLTITVPYPSFSPFDLPTSYGLMPFFFSSCFDFPHPGFLTFHLFSFTLSVGQRTQREGLSPLSLDGQHGEAAASPLSS